MNRISRPVQNISSIASRAQASYTSPARALGCTDVYGFCVEVCGSGMAPNRARKDIAV